MCRGVPIDGPGAALAGSMNRSAGRVGAAGAARTLQCSPSATARLPAPRRRAGLKGEGGGRVGPGAAGQGTARGYRQLAADAIWSLPA
jgi:hypothetical protein